MFNEELFISAIRDISWDMKICNIANDPQRMTAVLTHYPRRVEFLNHVSTDAWIARNPDLAMRIATLIPSRFKGMTESRLFMKTLLDKGLRLEQADLETWYRIAVKTQDVQLLLKLVRAGLDLLKKLGQDNELIDLAHTADPETITQRLLEQLGEEEGDESIIATNNVELFEQVCALSDYAIQVDKRTLFLAVASNAADIVEYASEITYDSGTLEAYLKMENDDGLTPLALARQLRHEECEEILQEWSTKVASESLAL